MSSDKKPRAGTQVDLLELARKLLSFHLLLFLAVGAALGDLAARLRGELHAIPFAVSYGPLACEENPAFVPHEVSYKASFPASLVEGHDLRESDLPAPLRDHHLSCQFDEAKDRALVSCEVRGADRLLATRLARLAETQLLTGAEKPLGVAFSEERILAVCGWDYFVRLGSNGDASLPRAKGSLVWSTPALVRLRDLNAAGAKVLAAQETPAPRPLTRAGAFLGAILGLLAATLRALGRSSARAPGDASEVRNPVGAAACAGLLLTTAMDTVLTADVGPFTLRFGHLCALVLLVSEAALLGKAGRPILLPRRLLEAAAAFLAIAALSAFWSGQPVKSLGYLAWAAFDLAIVLPGVLAHLSSERRLARAARLWTWGIALSAAMGLEQIGSFLLGRRPPLVWMTSDGFPRINGFSYEPSYYCLYLLPGAILLLTRFALLGRKAWKSAAGGLLLVLAVALSTSRSGWLGAAVAFVLLASRAQARLGRRGVTRMALSAGVVLLASGAVLSFWPSLRTHVERLGHMAFDRWEATSTGPRIESLRQAATLTRRHPVLGVGFGGYGAYVLAHPEFPQPNAPGPHAVVTTNLYLETAAETGLVGLAAALALLATLLMPLWRAVRVSEAVAEMDVTREGLLMAAVVVFLVLFQFSQTLWRLDIWVLLSLCFAAGQALPQGGKAARRPVPGQA
jgi:O-antigen ligase